jgi:alpha-tubulin suppressor-like RCC1 family protein
VASLILVALSAGGCRSVAVDDFPASVNHRCPPGFVLTTGDRCVRPGTTGAGEAGADRPGTLERPDAPGAAGPSDAAPVKPPDASTNPGESPADGGGMVASMDARSNCVEGSGPPGVIIAAGLEHTCTATSMGHVTCWGSNTNGQLGDGTTSNANSPRIVSGLGMVSALAAGGNTTCAVVNRGAIVSCWGQHAGNQTITTTPTPVPGLTGVRALAGGLGFMCALLLDGSVRCWGNGLEANTDPFPPAPVMGVANAAAMSAGNSHACAAITDGTVSCWRSDILGNPEAVGVYQIPGITGATRVVGGGGHNCAIAGGALWCWGDNRNGETGSRLLNVFSPPARVMGLNDVIDVAAGSAQTCALLNDGLAYCWGENGIGQLGDGTNYSRTYRDRPVTCVNDMTAIAAGARHVCAVSSSRGVVCWGDNSSGQLGVPGIRNSTFPVPVRN